MAVSKDVVAAVDADAAKGIEIVTVATATTANAMDASVVRTIAVTVRKVIGTVLKMTVIDSKVIETGIADVAVEAAIAEVIAVQTSIPTRRRANCGPPWRATLRAVNSPVC